MPNMYTETVTFSLNGGKLLMKSKELVEILKEHLPSEHFDGNLMENR